MAAFELARYRIDPTDAQELAHRWRAAALFALIVDPPTMEHGEIVEQF